MKCPNCNGVPYDEVWTCDVCDGKGIVEPLTEQEYLQTCTTEQLADILLHIADSCYWAGFFKGKEDADGYDDDYCLINQNIVEWLKQPHKERIMTKEELQKKYSEILKQKKLKPLWGDEHDPCEHCSANPKNGGSGLCNCTLACPKIT